MDRKLLPKGFFRKNPLETKSSAMFAYVSMTCIDEELNNALFDMGREFASAGRMEKIEEERNEIARLDSGEAVVRFMRRGCDIMNDDVLADKALTMQEQAMPLVLDRFRTTGQNKFIEIAVRALVKAEQVYVERLKAMYPEIRNPYAQNLACLVFGIRGCEDTVPLLLSEYERMKREYPDESYCQGPLAALYILFDEL